MTNPHSTWDAVDGWVEELFLGEDADLARALTAAEEAGLPAIQVSAAQGRMLELLVRLIGAREVLEVGTLGGYSTICLARGLPAGGRLVTLELDPRHAEVATASLAAAGLSGVVEVRVGPAVQTLATMSGTFDLVFIDADKVSTPTYVTEAVRLSHPGTLIVVDNVVRNGAVADAATTDEAVLGMRRFAEVVAADPRLRGTVIQTVGRKGYDGFALVRVGE
jgi:caffeoyl-CoA O-methyltransferase